MKVTEDDRALLDAIEALEVHDDEAALMACELIATHRQSAERRALERAAEVADQRAVECDKLGETHFDRTARYHNECRAIEARQIAQAIRALGDE